MLGKGISPWLGSHGEEGQAQSSPAVLQRQDSDGLQGGIVMGKAKMYGMVKPFTPKADRKSNKPFTGAKKKGKAKK